MAVALLNESLMSSEYSLAFLVLLRICRPQHRVLCMGPLDALTHISDPGSGLPKTWVEA